MSPVSYRNFPLRFYQITPKFRDEMKPRFGLIRAKEFLMKDMYTFDVDMEAAIKTYELVNEQYSKLLNTLKVPFVKIGADTGVMGGKISHEYQILTSIGEDEIVTCAKCSKAVNKELCSADGKICEKCQHLQHHQGIEIAHTFVLEDKYSKALKATYLSKTGKPIDLQMGCYGIGVTRLIATSIELLSTETEIRWPLPLAPYKICIISPKDGSKEESTVKHLTDEIYHLMESCEGLKDEILVDDRTSMTIGKRLMDTKKLGIPFIVVIGSKAAESESLLEVHSLLDGSVALLNISETISFIKSHIV
jgi:prolyl-tRNA synthetase